MDFSNLPTPCYVFFGLFLAFSLFELVFAFLEKELARKIVKPFCVACLAFLFAFWHPEAWWIALGFAFGALGDLLLVFKHKVWTFVLGTFFFFLNHVAFILAYFLIAMPLPSYQYWIIGVFGVLVLAGGYPLLHKVIKTPALSGGGVVYLTSILLDLLLSILALADKMYPVGFFNLAGMVCFCVSDTYLVKTLFVKDDKRRDFYIMGTYLLAQVLILFGFGFYL